MSITEEDLNKLSELAKLDLEDAEFKNKLINNLNNILSLFDQLKNIDSTCLKSLESIEPMIHPDEHAKLRLRPDLVTEHNVRNTMLNIAPPNSVDAGLYLVPKVIESN